MIAPWSSAPARSDPDQKARLLLGVLTAAFGGEPEELQFRAVGPTIGQRSDPHRLHRRGVGLGGDPGFIIWAFRNVPHPVRFGVAAIIAMLHDVLITTGVFSIMGWVAGWEVDALFLTALLTVIGFSVQDTIVVFDRIRENTRRRGTKISRPSSIARCWRPCTARWRRRSTPCL